MCLSHQKVTYQLIVVNDKVYNTLPSSNFISAVSAELSIFIKSTFMQLNISSPTIQNCRNNKNKNYRVCEMCVNSINVIQINITTLSLTGIIYIKL